MTRLESYKYETLRVTTRDPTTGSGTVDSGLLLLCMLTVDS